jgi:hypothetical protein
MLFETMTAQKFCAVIAFYLFVAQDDVTPCHLERSAT